MSLSSILMLFLHLSLVALTEAFVVSSFTNSRSHTLSRNWRLCATWSDSKAVKEYQDFLNSGRQDIERKPDQASVIIYDGVNTDLATCLFTMGGGDDIYLTPDQPLPEKLGGSTEYPIYITLRPWLLNQFFDTLREDFKEKGDDFCFFSGGIMGNIEDSLKLRGYCRDSMTQILIGGLGLTPSGRPQDLSVNLGLDSNGDNKLANQCTACGKWAGAISERLQRSQVTCAIDFYREWRRKMWERSFYDAVFPLVGAVRDQPTTVADVARYYEPEVSDMLWNLSQLLRGWRAVTLLYGFEERLLGTAEMQGAETQCQPLAEPAMFYFTWGMNVFTESQMVVDYLWFCRTEKGYLEGIDLPPQKSDADYTSHMRKGNLRADGVI